MRTVITVHGMGLLGEQGPWQDNARQVFEPHFTCVTVKYPHYRWVGPLLLIIEPWILLPCIGILSALKWYSLLPSMRYLGTLWAWILAFLLSYLGTGLRRLRALKFVLKQTNDTALFLVQGHVLAHSMGTYLFGQILKKFPDSKFGDIILAGCVLPVRWPWVQIKMSHPPAFQRVRNEVGGKDWVVFLAYFAGVFLPNFGMAGLRGFEGEPASVHDLDSPLQPCANCSYSTTALVHNVKCLDFSHNDIFASPSYISYFWLPYLWGIDAAEYSDFLLLCLSIQQHLKDNDFLRARNALGVLRKRSWRWAGNRTIMEYIESYLVAASVPDTPENIETVLMGTTRVISIGCDAYRKKNAGWRSKVRALEPEFAIGRAIVALSRS
jgi:pimeloyl-ACP methyl ester carboxylesterase